MNIWKSIIVFASPLVLAGCAGMNSDFEFDKPARDSGIWMSQADDMSVSHRGSAAESGKINLNEYRLINTGNIRMDVQRPYVQPKAEPQRWVGTSELLQFVHEYGQPDIAGNTAAQPISTVAYNGSASCNTPRCYPEPSSAFRTPDGSARIWIAPYVSPDDNAHMGETVYSVVKPSSWSGIY